MGVPCGMPRRASGSGGITQLQGPPARAGPGQAVVKTRVGSKSALKLFVAVTPGSADTANGQFVTGTIQSTGILAAGRNSIPQVTTKRAIYLTPR